MNSLVTLLETPSRTASVVIVSPHDDDTLVFSAVRAREILADVPVFVLRHAPAVNRASGIERCAYPSTLSRPPAPSASLPALPTAGSPELS